jgi:hypothetical protein
MSPSVEALPPPPSPDTYDRYFGVRRLWQTKPANSRRLFPFERIFDAADGVLNLALDLVGLALRLQFCVTDRVADGLFYRAFDLLSRSDDAIPVHDFLLKDVATPVTEMVTMNLAQSSLVAIMRSVQAVIVNLDQPTSY